MHKKNKSGQRIYTLYNSRKKIAEITLPIGVEPTLKNNRQYYLFRNSTINFGWRENANEEFVGFTTDIKGNKYILTRINNIVNRYNVPVGAIIREFAYCIKSMKGA